MKFDVIVIGGGHAGVEACLAPARMNLKVGLITLDFKHVAFMPCNPSIGGPAKGVVVREIDALGGEMGKAADATALQVKMLNTAKGAGVQCLRDQSDKIEYALYMQHKIQEEPNITVIESMAVELITHQNQSLSVKCSNGEIYETKTMIITTGTYLESNILVGHTSKIEGPDQQPSAWGLSESLRKLGFQTMRLKTGTPPRIYRDSIDFSKMEPQYGSEGELSFSYETTKFLPLEDQLPCYLIHTTPELHQMIQDHLLESAMYGGMVKGIGPRYCPSIEDKIVKFKDKERHQIFVEPESVHLDTVYLQGFSTSMPVETQDKMIHALPGFENCRVKKYAYAIEYDAIDPMQLYPSLESKTIEGLFFAGQINGTSGYEEAAGQGLMAGINAGLKVQGKDPLVLRRDEAYIGVMIDDLINKGTQEPYRLLTSRAEYRLLLRHDNADLRLREYGHQVGLISDELYTKYQQKVLDITTYLGVLKNTRFTKNHPINEYLKEHNSPLIETGLSAYDLLKRTEITMEVLLPYLDEFKASKEVQKQLEIVVKYEGYLTKQEKEAKAKLKLEDVRIPKDMDYQSLENIATEAKQKLIKVRPLTIGQASRISGVNPADISILLMHLKSLEKGKKHD